MWFISAKGPVINYGECGGGGGGYKTEGGGASEVLPMLKGGTNGFDVVFTMGA